LKQKFATGGLFTLLLVAGALTASALAGMEPLRALQTTTVPTTVVTVTTAPTTTTETTTTTTPAPPRRVTICHHVRGKKGFRRHVTIRIARRAWTPHQRHGDSVGACNTATAKKFHNRLAHKKKWHKRRR
jgi:hypothetical protein